MNKKKSPTCAVLLIGNELLSGRTEDVNFNHIARRMKGLGIQMRECRIVPDIQKEIISSLNELREKYSYIFTTGGIGPTHDDITVASIAKAFDVQTKRDPQTVAAFHEHYGDKITEATLKMATFPEGANLIHNPATIAPGFYLGNVFAFAGVPHIMREMLECVIPLLDQGEKIYTRSIDILAGESQISEGFEKIQENHPQLDLGSYPSRIGNQPMVSLVVQGTDKNSVDNAFTDVENLLNDLSIEVRT